MLSSSATKKASHSPTGSPGGGGRSSSQLSGGEGGGGVRSPSPTHGGGGGAHAKDNSIDPIVQFRYLCLAVANLGALEVSALEFVRLGVHESLASLLDNKDLNCASAAAHAIRNLSSFAANPFCTLALVEKLTTRLQLGEHLTPQAFVIMSFMSHAAGALWNISREDRSTIMLMNASTIKHALGSLPCVLPILAPAHLLFCVSSD